MVLNGASAAVRGEKPVPHRKSVSRLAAVGVAALVGALALTGCETPGHPGGYIEAYYQNGDPIYSPLKSQLFAEDGTPLCSIPIYEHRFETRYRPFANNGGVMNAFLFEVTNPELDPDAPVINVPNGSTEADQRERLRRIQDSLGAMYQLTHPVLFDEPRGIEGPEDMRSVKDKLRHEFPELGIGNHPIVGSISPGDQWMESSLGRFSLRRLGDPETFFDVMGIKLDFNGLLNDYYEAIQGTDSYVLVRNRETGESQLVNSDGPVDIENIQVFSQYKVLLEPGQPDSAAAIFTLANDGCPDDGDTHYARWWVADIEYVDPVTGNGNETEEPSPEPSAEPSASPSPSA